MGIFAIEYYIFKTKLSIIKTTKKKPNKKVTPLMQQYFGVKQRYPDALLLFRVGDFYETFGEDAVTASQILGIVLTSRNNGGSDIELAGFPYHSVDVYLPKLVKAGYRVAICEQLEKPSKEKKIVKRDVTEVVTPGVTLHDTLLDANQNNFLASIVFKGDKLGVAFLDISTGEFIVHQGTQNSIGKLIRSFNPNEVIYSKAQKEKLESLINDDVYQYGMDDWFYDADYNRDILLKHFKVLSLKGYSLDDEPLMQIAAGSILHYLSTIQHGNVAHIQKLTRIESDHYMWLDEFTIRNLELVRSNHYSGTCLKEVIDHTSSPMGARMLDKWIVLPLKNLEEIHARQNRVSFFLEHETVRDHLRLFLKAIGDLERLASKIPLRKINPREFQVVARAIEKKEQIILSLNNNADLDIKSLIDRISDCHELKDLINQTLVEEAPVSLNKGSVIKLGFNEELDEWKNIAQNGKNLLAELQANETERTGISSLKVGFNNVFGYYLEVTNKYKDQDLIPEDWTRKQTLKNAERYITPELKILENKILQAQEKIGLLEAQFYEELIDKAEVHVSTLLSNSKVLAELDCYLSFAHLADYRQYSKPEIDDSFIIDIKQGRHPVIESQLSVDDPYIPNDVYLDKETQQIIMITGPNMSGKSAVLRQTALICLLAHMGSYVPAQSAQIGIVDKIFTRVGASDNISSGESTFMVEMNETSSILNNLSSRSLILLDEIGRGTSTYDGISIAWSIAEYLHNDEGPKPKTLFATHYHELNQLENTYDRIKNYNVAIKEVGDTIIFLRKLVEGASKASFGIHVAQLAGMPKDVVNKAQSLLKSLEAKSIASNEKVGQAVEHQQVEIKHQLQIFDEDSLEVRQLTKIIKAIDLQTMTPIECMLKLKELKDFIKKST